MDYDPLLGADENHPTNPDAPDGALVAVHGQVNDFACTPPRQANNMATIQDANLVQSFDERFTNPSPLCNLISSTTMLEAGMFNKVPMLNKRYRCSKRIISSSRERLSWFRTTTA
jgi:hypothetical protein